MEALTLGSIVLPNIIFMLYFIQQGRTAVVALPVIFFYVMAKTFPYAIRSFGNVKKPYRILLTSSCLALGGVGLAFFRPLLPEGRRRHPIRYWNGMSQARLSTVER